MSGDTNPLGGYRIGLVMTRAGLNDNQLVYFRNHVRDVRRVVSDRVTLVVPACTDHGSRTGHPKDRALTQRLVDRVVGAAVEGDADDSFAVRIIDTADIAALMPELLELDEVWCATMPGGRAAETTTRPGKVYAAAQAHRQAPRFKLLHYWIELPPQLVPSADRGKKTKPTKGY